ncbi:YhcH/YjgK/YiaL family protein [Aliagarivorans marinus]|uniref:YhcH/YjgK/YiaL family protein n=1 Tax=Aliagarivorans marinus TaxID=561965 RepID=UPI0004228157|nr:YhcH/YjgK/YiaL family protein [Aliagarivorans marinus]
MLFGNVEKLGLVAYIQPTMEKLINEAWALAKSEADGKYELSEQDAFLILTHADTEPTAVRKAEIHKQYIDVQILVSGEEKLGYTNELNPSDLELQHLENDVKFYSDVDAEQFVTLGAGDFAVFFPNQPHRPLCAVDKPQNIRKAIVKIPKALFDN